MSDLDGADRHLIKFAGHAQAGDWQSALVAASEACHAAPRKAASHYAYGEAWMALNQPAKAQQAFSVAIQLAPSWVDAWVNYGLALYRQGAVEEAKAALRQALRHQPYHAVATANLGVFLRVTGQMSEATKLLRQALAYDPGNVGARLNLVADLMQEGRPAEALALLDAAPHFPAEPAAQLHWGLQETLALLQLHRLDEVRPLLDVLETIGPIPPELAPLWHWRHVVLAQKTQDRPGARQAAERMAAAIPTMGPKAVLEHLVVAHFDLGGYWDSEGDVDRAMAHWHAGHALLRRSRPFAREAHLARIDATIAAFARGCFAPELCATNNDARRVYIVGMPGSGVGFCQRSLAEHPRISVTTVLAPLLLPRDMDRDMDLAQIGRIATGDISALEDAAAPYLTTLRSLASPEDKGITIVQCHSLSLGLVGRLLPGGRIIHCISDPRDLGLSIYKTRQYGEHGYAHDLADIGWAIAQEQRLMAHWQGVLPNAFLELRASDWVEDFTGTLCRILAFLDVPQNERQSLWHDSVDRAQTVTAASIRHRLEIGRVGGWRDYAQHLAPLIAEL